MNFGAEMPPLRQASNRQSMQKLNFIKKRGIYLLSGHVKLYSHHLKKLLIFSLQKLRVAQKELF